MPTPLDPPPPPAAQPPRQGPDGRRVVLTWALVLSVLCVVWTIGSTVGDSAVTPTVSSASARAHPATSVPAPTSTPPLGPPGSERATTAAVAAALGPCNRPEPRIIMTQYRNGLYQVRFNLNDGFLDGITRASARRDVLAIIRAVKASGLPLRQLAVVGAFPMTDAYGNTGNIVVLSLIYSAATLNRINPDGVDWLTSNNLYAVADRHQVERNFVS